MEGLGGVVLQDNSRIACEPRKLKIHEKTYVVYDLESVVVIHALKMWRHYLLGKKFTFLTNRFSLKYLFSHRGLNSKKA